MDAARLTAMFEEVPALVNGDEDLVRRGAWCDAQFAIGIGEIPFYATVRNGRIVEFERGPALMRSWQFAVRGTEAAWREFWRPLPAPDSYDVLALVKRGVASIDGDLHPFLANLQYFKDVLAKPRQLSHRDQ